MFDSVSRRARSVAVLGVSAALVVGGVAVAQGGNDGKSGNSGKAKQGKRHGKRMGPPPGGPIGGPAAKDLTYGELHVRRNGEDETIRIDAGKVVSTSDSSITLKENDGNEVTVEVDGDTKVLAGPGRDKSVTDLKQGQKVVVSGPEGEAAKAVMVPPRHGHRPPRPPQGGPPQMQG
jgi:hypothetical protein